MKVAIFSTHKFEREYLVKANIGKYELLFIEAQFSLVTTALAQGCEAVSIFVNDDASQNILEVLHYKKVENKIRFIRLYLKPMQFIILKSN